MFNSHIVATTEEFQVNEYQTSCENQNSRFWVVAIRVSLPQISDCRVVLRHRESMSQIGGSVLGYRHADTFFVLMKRAQSDGGMQNNWLRATELKHKIGPEIKIKVRHLWRCPRAKEFEPSEL